MTYTFATMDVSKKTYDEIAGKLREAGYDHAFVDGALDMHGIALTKGNASSGWRAIDDNPPKDGKDVLTCIPGFDPRIVRWVTFEGESRWSPAPEDFLRTLVNIHNDDAGVGIASPAPLKPRVERGLLESKQETAQGSRMLAEKGQVIKE